MNANPQVTTSMLKALNDRVLCLQIRLYSSL